MTDLGLSVLGKTIIIRWQLVENYKRITPGSAEFAARLFFNGGNSCVPSVASEQVLAANSRIFSLPNCKFGRTAGG